MQSFATLLLFGLYCNAHALPLSEIPVQRGLDKDKVAAHVVRALEQKFLEQTKVLRGSSGGGMRFQSTNLRHLNPVGDGGGSGFPMSGDLMNQISGDKQTAISTDVPTPAGASTDVNDKDNRFSGLEQALKNNLAVSPNPSASPLAQAPPEDNDGYAEEQDHINAERLALKNKAAIDGRRSWSDEGWSGEAPVRFTGIDSGTNAADDNWTVDALDILKNNVLQKETRVEIAKEQAETERLQKEEEDVSLNAQIAAVKKQIQLMKDDNKVLKSKVASISAKDVNQQAALDKMKAQFSM